jgi:membrane protein
MVDAGDDRASPRRTSVLTRIVASVDRWQRRHAVAGFPLAVLKKFQDDRVSSQAALVAYYAFLSLFPLLLAFVSIVGFVLDDNPALRADVIDSALARIPAIGVELGDEVQPLTGSSVALAVGLAGALWAGLGVTLALGRAFAEIGDTPRIDQPSGLKARLRGLGLLVVLGVTLVVSTAVAGIALFARVGPAAERGATIAGALAVNGITFLAVFALLTPRPWRLRDLLPGVGLAAVAVFAVQSLGGWYIDRVVVDATPVYGTFAIVIGLLTWFWLISHLLLIAAAVNVVRRWRLWPRALTGPLEPADRRALRRLAEATRRDDSERIAVSFGDVEPE